MTGLWKPQSSKKFIKEEFNDGIMEVIGLTDVCHMGQVQVGMDEAFQVGQGRKIQLKSKENSRIIHLQIDGEPMEIITPFEITIERKDQVNVLATTPTDNGKIMRFIRQAKREGVVSEEQFQELMAFSKKFEA